MTQVDEHAPMTFEQDVLDLALESLRDRQDSELIPARRRRRPRRGTVIAIAAAGIAIAIAVPIAIPGGGTGGAEPAAAALLHRVALRAAEQAPEATPGPGQFLYTRSQSMPRLLYVADGGITFFFTQPIIRESWIGLDGSGRILNTAGTVTFPTKEDRAAWIAAGSPDICPEVCEGDTGDDLFSPGELTYSDYTDLPTDPEELLALIESRQLVGGPAGDWETFSIVGDLLRETSTQPRVRAALYRVAADIRGVELVGRVVDSAGRPGVAVAYTSVPGRGVEFIFDPTTAELLGENFVNVEDSDIDVEIGSPGDIYGAVGPAGTTTYSITYLVSGVVDSTTESL